MGTFRSKKVAAIKTMHVALCIQVRGQQARKRHTSYHHQHINLHNLKHTKESHSCTFNTPIVLDPATGGTTTDEGGTGGAGEGE